MCKRLWLLKYRFLPAIITATIKRPKNPYRDTGFQIYSGIIIKSGNRRTDSGKTTTYRYWVSEPPLDLTPHTGSNNV